MAVAMTPPQAYIPAAIQLPATVKIPR